MSQMVCVYILQVNITIDDANDNRPQFLSAVTVLSVAEDTPTDLPLYTILAADSDEGANGIVTYQLTINANQMFKINENSGVLSLQVCAVVKRSICVHTLSGASCMVSVCCRE